MEGGKVEVNKVEFEFKEVETQKELKSYRFAKSRRSAFGSAF